MNSSKFHLDQTDWDNWAKNILLFASPLILLFLTAYANGTPLHDAILLVYAAALNAVIDLLRKWIAGGHIAVQIQPTTQYVVKSTAPEPPANP